MMHMKNEKIEKILREMLKIKTNQIKSLTLENTIF
jgi:hypothetical protein